MTDIADFVDDVLPAVQGCPRVLITREVRRTITDFCRKSHVLKKDFEHQAVAADVDPALNYAVDVSISGIIANVKPYRLTGLRIDTDPWKTEQRDVLNEAANFRQLVATGIKYYRFPDDATVRIHPLEQRDNDLYLSVVFVPEDNATEIADELYDDWIDEIAAGAKSRLQRMPDKAWTNLDAALINMNLYRRGIAEASRKALSGFLNKSFDDRCPNAGRI